MEDITEFFKNLLDDHGINQKKKRITLPEGLPWPSDISNAKICEVLFKK